MSIIDGTGLVTWEGGLFEPNSDLLRRVQWAFAKIRADGGHIELNEAGRPFGVPGDMNVRNASQTASGRSTVWFQWGRYKRGETPSAANPNSGQLASEHTQGIAIDCNAEDVYTATLRVKYFAMVGMKQTISSESWHWAIRGNPTVEIATVAAGGGATLLNNNREEDDDMPTSIVMQEPNKTLWLLPEDGSMTALKSMDELASLIMTDAVKIVRPEATGNDRYWIPAAQNTINLRKQIATRKGALRS
jgi:hypothetical protein